MGVVQRIILIVLLFLTSFLLQGFTLRETKTKVTSPKVAKVKQAQYCEGHERKIVNVPSNALADTIQDALNNYDADEYDHNGRYELCFDIKTEPGVVALKSTEQLTLNNTSDREVVIGFLNLRRKEGHEDSMLSLFHITGHNVTLFQPQLSNAKRAITLEGDGHKLIGGVINGVANATDSLCVEGIGNDIEIKDATINDCVNGISLNGNDNRVEKTTISFSRLAEMPQLKESATKEEKEQYLADFEQWLANNFAATGTCLSLEGQKAALQDVTVNVCDGISIKLSGADHSVINTQVVGQPIPEESGLPGHSTDCLFLQNASNVTLEANTFANCQTGVYVVDSQSIFIGPELIENFAAKKNTFHHNDYAIHVEKSQAVYARHNAVFENGGNLAEDLAHNFGWWLEESNQSLAAPNFEPADGEKTNDEEYPVVKYDENGNGFVDVKVPVQSGKLELNFPYNLEYYKHRYQSSTPFADCAFEDASPSPQPSPIEGEGKELGTVSYLVRCPIPTVTDDIKGKRLLAILHANPIGSSPFAKALGIINEPTGTPVWDFIPTTGSMTGGSSEKVPGASPSPQPSPIEGEGKELGTFSDSSGIVAQKEGGGSGGSAFCNLLVGQKNEGTDDVLWYTLFVIAFLIVLRRGALCNHQKKI